MNIFDYKLEPSSFRDPDTVVLYYQGKVYRKIHTSYLNTFNKFTNSDLFKELINKKLLIPHQETTEFVDDEYPRCIKPDIVLWITYFYEWSFDQLRDAALLTLEILQISIKHGFILKDASSYNIQFYQGKPLLIDIGSFEEYIPGKPWAAYRQFCQHFLAPLAICSFKDYRLNKLLYGYVDGIPLDLASALMPWYTYLNSGLLLHIHFHAKGLRYSKYIKKATNTGVKQNQLLNILKHLAITIKELPIPKITGIWNDYYKEHNYTEQGLFHKKTLIETWISADYISSAIDFGSNDGTFSYLLANKGINVLSIDIDEAPVNRNYNHQKKTDNIRVLPIVGDLFNPSPAIGWLNIERQSLSQRLYADLILCLALIHHLVFGNNLNMEQIASYFAERCSYLLIEFIPKEDNQVQKLLQFREDIYPNYNQRNFELVFTKHFTVLNKCLIMDSKRTLYLYKKNNESNKENT